MRDLSPSPIDSKNALRSSKAWTSRKSRPSAPATCPAFQVIPPSSVRTYVPKVPLAHTTFLLTTARPRSRALVTLGSGAHWAAETLQISKDPTIDQIGLIKPPSTV